MCHFNIEDIRPYRCQLMLSIQSIASFSTVDLECFLQPSLGAEQRYSGEEYQLLTISFCSIDLRSIKIPERVHWRGLPKEGRNRFTGELDLLFRAEMATLS